LGGFQAATILLGATYEKRRTSTSQVYFSANHGPLGLIPLMATKRDAQSSKRVFSIRQEFLLEPRGVLRHLKSIIVACSKLELEIKASYFEAHFTNPSSQSLLERPHPSYASSQMRKP
jgi:hypothetical protein